MSPPARIDWPTIQPVFRAWERLRLLYNGVLIPLVLIALAVTVQSADRGTGQLAPAAGATFVDWTLWWVLVCCYGIFANLCFLFGPLIESYSAWLGGKPSWLRVALFAAGTVFTAAAAWLFVTVTVSRMVGPM